MAELDDDIVVYLGNLSEVQGALDDLAGEVEATVLALANEHVDSGDYIESITTEVSKHKSGVLDRVVSTSDPDAVAIEYGYVDKDGEYVPGQLIFTRAASAP